MSFGIGVGDIVEVTKIAYTLYNHVTVGRTSATQHYTQIQHSLHALTFALKNLSNQAHTLTTSSTSSPSSPSSEDAGGDTTAKELSSIIQNCKEDLQSVDDFLKKYLLVADPSSLPSSGASNIKGKTTGVRYTLRKNYEKIKFSATQEKELTSLNTRLRGQIDAINLLVQTALLHNQQTSSTAQIALSKAHEAGLKKLEEAVRHDPALEKMEEILALLKSIALHAGGVGGAGGGLDVMGMGIRSDSAPPTYEDISNEGSGGGGVQVRGMGSMGGMGAQQSRDITMESTPNIHFSSFAAMPVVSDMPPIQPHSKKATASFKPMMAKMALSSLSSSPPPSSPSTMQKKKKSKPSASSAAAAADEYYQPDTPFEIFDPHHSTTQHTDAASAYASSTINKKRGLVGKKEYDMWMYSHHRRSDSFSSDISVDATSEDVLLDSIGTYLNLIRDCTLPGEDAGKIGRYEMTVKKYVNLNHLLSKKWMKNLPVWSEKEREEKRKVALDMLLSLNETIRGKSGEEEGEEKGEERGMLCRWLKECGVEDVVGRLEGVGKTVMWVKQVQVLEGYLANV